MDQVSYFAAPGIKNFAANLEERLEWLLDTVISTYNISAPIEKRVYKSDILGQTRKRHVVLIRHVFCYVVKARYPKATFETIAEFLGGRDHTTILHSVQTTQDLVDIKDEETLTLLKTLNIDTDAYHYRKTTHKHSSRK